MWTKIELVLPSTCTHKTYTHTETTVYILTSDETASGESIRVLYRNITYKMNEHTHKRDLLEYLTGRVQLANSGCLQAEGPGNCSVYEAGCPRWSFPEKSALLPVMGWAWPQERASFLLVLCAGCHQKLWPRSKVALSTSESLELGLPISNDSVIKTIPHRGFQLLGL